MPSVSVPFSGADSADQASTPQQSYMPSTRPGIRVGGEVTISHKSDGSQVVEYTSGAVSGVQSHSAPSSSPLKFSGSGVPVLGRDARSDDLVDLGGAIFLLPLLGS
jgi:hypothetical protein